jgi:hypothetical protein
MKYLTKYSITQIQVIKHQLLVAILAISGFTISSLAIAAAANAQTTIMAALYQNPPMSQSEVQPENRDASIGQITIALNSSPEMLAITENMIIGDSYDRIVTMSHSQGIACLVNGQGSNDGTVMCGLIDYE